MPLKLVEPPQGGFERVQAALNRLRARPLQRLSVERARAELLEALAPHPVYELSLSAAAEGGGAGRLQLTSFRWLLGDGDGSLAAAEVSVDAAGAAGEIRHVSEGPFVEATERAIRIAEARAEVGAGEFEVRLIRSAALRFVALWLAEKDGARDFAIPLTPAPPWMKAEEPLPLEELFRRARTAAQNALAQPNDPWRRPGV